MCTCFSPGQFIQLARAEEFSQGALERVRCDFWSHGEPLHFGECIDVGGVTADTRTITRVAEATKGSVGLVGNGLFIDVDLAGTHHIGQFHGLTNIAEQADGQTVFGGVDDLCCFLEGRERPDRGDRTENLLAPGGAILGQVCDDGW